MDNVSFYLGILLAIFVRWTVSLGSYSGQGKPPMYGDFEAQRHWMEITWNLPIKDWYVNGSNNDLLYWGLDYPPLTAYHSWLCGYIAYLLNPTWVALFTSRGLETYQHKLFMRYTVLIADLLFYFSGLVAYFYIAPKTKKTKDKVKAITVALLSPSLILIDHGHFQYNCISLGLALWGVVGLMKGHHLLGSIAFCLALNYKQMELYHSLPFFCYLLGNCLNTKSEYRFFKLCKLCCIVLITFAICWWPFIQNEDLVFQVLNRLFPFARGLYEDKVGNIWCSLSAFIKFKNIFSPTELLRISLVSTLLALLPSSLHLLIKPTSNNFKYALVNSSLVFFLFSFQVHEKSILLAALPVTLLLTEHPLTSLWFLLISSFSMLPLIIKDGLVLQYFVVCALFFLAVAHTYDIWVIQNDLFKEVIFVSFLISIFGASVLSLLSLFVPPPMLLPDLHAVINALYSCIHFCVFAIFFHWRQYSSELIDIKKIQ